MLREPYTQLYIHLTWSTWDRLPVITEEICSRLYAAMAVKCRTFKCEPLEIGGIEDHIHLLVRLHLTVPIAKLVQEVKGASSHLVNHQLTNNGMFKWQGAYGAFSIRKSEVPQVVAYIRNQKEHHARGSIDWEWECLGD